MSGGSYDYAFRCVTNFVLELYTRDITPLRQSFADHLFKVSKAMKAIEWADDGDSSETEAEKAIKDCLGL